jgi:hypothetical protein
VDASNRTSSRSLLQTGEGGKAGGDGDYDATAKTRRQKTLSRTPTKKRRGTKRKTKDDENELGGMKFSSVQTVDEIGYIPAIVSREGAPAFLSSHRASGKELLPSCHAVKPFRKELSAPGTFFVGAVSIFPIPMGINKSRYLVTESKIGSARLFFFTPYSDLPGSKTNVISLSQLPIYNNSYRRCFSNLVKYCVLSRPGDCLFSVKGNWVRR